MGYLFPNCVECKKGYGFWDYKSTPAWKWKFCSLRCQKNDKRRKETKEFIKCKPIKSVIVVEPRKHYLPLKTAARDGECHICKNKIIRGAQYFRSGKKRKRKMVCSTECLDKNKKPLPPKRKYLKSVAEKNKSADFYLDGKWRVLRYEVLMDRGAKCEACGSTPKDGFKMHVDHIKPRSKFPQLQYDKNNLQILCEPCNMGKGAWDETDWRKK